MPKKTTAIKGRRPPFGPVSHPYQCVSLTSFSKDVLLAAADRAGYPCSNVVDLLIRKYGGQVTADDFPSPDGCPCDMPPDGASA